MDNVFETIIKPGLDSVPVLDLIHSEWHDGVKYRVTHTISQNIYTDFDQKLSGYLAAIRGKGFPRFKVAATVVKLTAKEAPAHTTPSYYDSVPHALAGVVDRAFARVGPLELELQRGDCAPGQTPPPGQRHKIDGAFVGLMTHGLAISSHMGATEFLEVAGELGVITIAPPGGLEPVVLQLAKGKVHVPGTGGSGSTDAPIEWPITAFAERVSTDGAAQNYLATVRHAVITEREAAILAFRAAAEDRIGSLQRALAGRALEGHWRESAAGLIARLRAALGDRLSGLSEDARGIAFDWCAQFDDDEKLRNQPLLAAG